MIHSSKISQSKHIFAPPYLKIPLKRKKPLIHRLRIRSNTIGGGNKHSIFPIMGNCIIIIIIVQRTQTARSTSESARRNAGKIYLAPKIPAGQQIGDFSARRFKQLRSFAPAYHPRKKGHNKLFWTYSIQPIITGADTFDTRSIQKI